MDLVPYCTAKELNYYKSCSQMSHYFKEKKTIFLAPRIFFGYLPGLSCSNDGQAKKQWLTPCSVFSFPFCKTFHSPMPGDSKALNKKKKWKH